MTPEIETLTTDDLLTQIGRLQAIQRSCPPITPKWRTASDLLAPLFEEMARRHPYEGAAS